MSNEDAIVHPMAIVEPGARIGRRSRIWAFVHILPGAVIGEDANLCDGVFVENDVVVGDGVTVKSGVQLWDGVRLGDRVFVGPNATFTNDRFPRSRAYPDGPRPLTLVCDGASIGANATILPGLRIGENALVGAGSVVTKNVPPNAVVAGSPARITGYVSAPTVGASGGPRDDVIVGAHALAKVNGARLYRMPAAADLRGKLTFGEVASDLPFVPRRYFIVYAVPSSEVRGEHAHRTLEQFLICVHGSCSVMLDDGTHRAEVRLDAPDVGVYVPALVWGVQYKYSRDAVLLVLASAEYEAADYIRDYAEFLAVVRADARR